MNDNNILRMSLKMGIEMAVHIATLNLNQLNKAGWVQYCITLYYQSKDTDLKIYVMPSNIDPGRQSSKLQNYAETASYSCYSQKYKIPDQTTYYFKAYLDTFLPQKLDLFIQIDLLFAENFKSIFQKTHSFVGKVKAKHNSFEYLPVCFDEFEALTLSGTFHSILMEYKFQKNEDECQLLQKEYKDFGGYLCSTTSNYRYSEIVSFYNFYRNNLEEELSRLQSRFNEISKMTLNHSKKSPYNRLNPNRKLFKVIKPLHDNSGTTLSSKQQNQLVTVILEDILSIKAIIYQNWNEFNQLIKVNSDGLSTLLKQAYQEQVRKRLKGNIYSHNIKHHDWTFGKYGDNSESHLQQVTLIKKKSSSGPPKEQYFSIQDVTCFHQHDYLNIFEEVYLTGNLPMPKPVPSSYKHIVFLVHGFQAHRNDLISLQLCLQAHLKVTVHISSANVGFTQDSIEIMGKRLATEVSKYLQIIKTPFKVSFIGHSMGGLIVRSALQHLSFLQDSLHAYISLCTPHLGYLYQTCKLVQAGLWFINSFQKCDSIQELTMQDRPNLKDTFLYKLAEKEQLKKFKKLSFIASSQDHYVPYNSARAEKNELIFRKDCENKEVICDMVDNMLCTVEASSISRVDVIFNIEELNFDSFIGRTGHIKFLSDPDFLRHLTIALDHLII